MPQIGLVNDFAESSASHVSGRTPGDLSRGARPRVGLAIARGRRAGPMRRLDARRDRAPGAGARSTRRDQAPGAGAEITRSGTRRR
jgi:hypothetical protein